LPNFFFGPKSNKISISLQTKKLCKIIEIFW
jgi:hypothetical protein